MSSLRKTVLLLGLFTGQMNAVAASLQIQITPQVAGENVQPASFRYHTSAGETFSITRVSYFVSDIALQRADGSWLELSNQVAWLDLGRNRDSFWLDHLPPGEYQTVRFAVGLSPRLNHESLTNFPAGAALNPDVNGLYWGWQGGYIFLALEGLWRNAAGELDGWAYHFARDKNLTSVSLAANLNLPNQTKLELAFDLGTLLNAPRPLSFAKDGSSTHSRDGDPVAAALKENLPGAFRVRRIRELTDAQIASARPMPLYLPAKFTPYPFQMSATFPLPDLPHDNPLTVERVALGCALFFEQRLSINNGQSCADCHSPAKAFTDGRTVARGAEGHFGPRNTMPLFNLAWKSSFFWDGRAASLREQVLQPITNAIEMHESLTNVVAKLGGTGLRSVVSGVPPEIVGAHSPQSMPHEPVQRSVTPPSGATPDGTGGTPVPPDPANYPALFTAAFGSPEITPEKIALALENYLLTLTAFDAKFDRVLHGEEKFTPAEQRGFELFNTEYDPRRGMYGADCFHCHGGPLFQSQTFANNGLDSEFADAGRAKITSKDYDRGKFAVPSLRNVALTAPYMHDGRFQTLEAVVEHYANGVKRSATLDPNLAKHPDGGVPLSAADQRALVAFLKTLTDDHFIRP